ncbi:SbcC/MukB-like Walker B domain-containing protein [Acanthopleuribacter pedis]|uniref:AAA family ATPase n=1 Tax=Acanthopleuribacter pedis TaxID=442870 RepID=A0A8J7U6M3_9BACT|nr:SbcC/MukB-like Walker B domain-containing protein [Acanthopleuribacter pedis]MBO1322922.1 AAA family ATPase [Acanthopleuribacter pedis]
MNTNDALFFHIHRIRLIQFHNIENATISLQRHLFLLGDNGSGKTTILDAVHYVLSGGLMEYNSAAHVAGAKRSGRTTQGIVMRYNAETGPLEKSGRVTYAALEMRNPRGQVMTVAIGMTTSSMEERITQWGLVESKPLEEVPLILEEAGGRRPATQMELKKLLGPKKVMQIGAFRKELANRLFGGEDTYRDVVHLLRMGKSYREMVSRSADYHELFVKLLPEPRSHIFEALITGLRDLEGAHALLDDLKRKTLYLEELKGLRDEIGTRREEIKRYAWLACHYHLNRLAEGLAAAARDLEHNAAIRLQLETELREHSRERGRLETRLDDLKAKDKSGLVAKEKELARRVAALSDKTHDKQHALAVFEKEHQVQLEALAKLHAGLVKTAVQARRDLAAGDLPLQLAEALGVLDQLARCSPDDDLATPSFAALIRESADLRDQTRAQQVLQAERIARLKQEIAAARDHLAHLEALVEFDLPAVAEAKKCLADHMITARPLYELLNWKAMVRKKAAGEIEAFIGPAVLGTLVVDDTDFDSARKVLVASGLSVALSSAALGEEPVPRWILDYFDPADPVPLTILAGEMTAAREPIIERIGERAVVAFRAHQRPLDAPHQPLIGLEARRAAHLAKIRTCKQQIREREAERKSLEKVLARDSALLSRLERFRALLLDARDRLREQTASRDLSRLQVNHQHRLVDQARRDLRELTTELNGEQTRLEEMRRHIQDAGLADLETKINNLNKKIQRLEKTVEAHQKQIGAAEGRTQGLEGRVQTLKQQEREQQERLAIHAAEIQALHPDLDDIAYYVLRTWRGNQFSKLENIESASRKSAEEASVAKGRLAERLKDPTMASFFAFYYNENDNKLSDRRGRSLKETLVAQQQTIVNQEQVINEKTNTLFKEIIHNELVRVLREQVYQLDDMMRHINRLLGQRVFGRNRYRFKNKIVDRCRELVETLHELAVFEEDAQKRLQDFLEDHQQEIVNTEPGEIPDLLDYRNWYRFEMTVTNVQNENGEGVTMDRAVKAVGSGGEQAVPNYLLVLTIAYFLYRSGQGKRVRLTPLIFDEAFYGIDAGRRDQLLAFADDLGLQLMVASPDQDGVKKEIAFSKTLLVMKDRDHDVHLMEFAWENPLANPQMSLLDDNEPDPIVFRSSQSPD